MNPLISLINQTLTLLNGDLDLKTKYYKVKSLEDEYALAALIIKDQQSLNILKFLRYNYFVDTNLEFSKYETLAQYTLDVLISVIKTKDRSLENMSEFKLFNSFYMTTLSHLRPNKNFCSNYVNEIIFETN